MIQIAANAKLPLSAVTETFGIMGMRGRGKTYLGTLLFEQMHAAGAQVVALDPIGNWWHLRLAANGKDPGLDVPVFGGPHGDIPLEPDAGALVARVVIERGISVILDVSRFRKVARKKFVTAFAEELFELKKDQLSPLHLFLEEARMFVPQRPQTHEDPRMLGAFEDIVRAGRNYGLGTSLLDQRPASVNKEVLSQVSMLVAFGLQHTLDRKAIEEWVREWEVMGADKLRDLPKLARGAAFLWAPSLSPPFRAIEVNEKATFDGSSTPEIGKGRKVEVRPLSDRDLVGLRESMKECVERAEARNVTALQARVRKLEAEARAGVVKPTEVKVVEKPVLKDGQIARLEKLANRLTAELHGRFDTCVNILRVEVQRVEELRNAVIAEGAQLRAALHQPKPANRAATFTRQGASLAPRYEPARFSPARIETRPVDIRKAPASGLARPQQAILDQLAALKALGRHPAPRAQVAVLSGASPKSSAYANNLSALRTAGLVEYRSGSELGLSDEGCAAATSPETAITLDVLHTAWIRKLSRPQAVILQAVILNYPKAIVREDLAAQAGASPTSSAYANNLSALHTLGVITYINSGSSRAIEATSLLFPEGLT